MRFRLTLIPLVMILPALALTALACGDDDDDDDGNGSTSTAPAGGSPAGDDANVTISDNRFSPDEVTIGVNHEVIWEWSGSNPHSVVGTFNGEEIRSPTLTGSGTFVHSFLTAGTFNYQCGVHGSAMSGSVVIQ
jgi:plastocyanin